MCMCKAYVPRYCRGVFAGLRDNGRKGGGLFESRTRPPPDPPKFLNLSFSNLRFWGNVLVLKAPILFFWPPEGYFFFVPKKIAWPAPVERGQTMS